MVGGKAAEVMFKDGMVVGWGTGIEAYYLVESTFWQKRVEKDGLTHE